MKRKFVVRSVLALGLAFLLVQAVPYGRSHTNPTVVAEPAWDSARTRELAARACFDCHSNETVWPWYSHVAPISWSVQEHVDEGRSVLNFSEWHRPWEEAEEAAETVREAEMPLRSYLAAHPEARLTPEERAELLAGLTATLGEER